MVGVGEIGSLKGKKYVQIIVFFVVFGVGWGWGEGEKSRST